MASRKKTANANLESMYRVFTAPEAPQSTLSQIEDYISKNLAGFLQEHIVAVERDLSEVEKDFADSGIPDKPMFVSEQAQFLLDKLVSNSVHTAAPSFIGHMTSALPYFMLPLSKIMIALNQNLVKTETSKAFTPLERQVLGMLHRLIYQHDDAYYAQWMHDPLHALGSMCSGGTVANLTALWVARNLAFPEEGGFKGIRREGLTRALLYYGYTGAAVLVSERGHYSLKKAADILGIGHDYIIPIPTNDQNKMDIDALRNECIRLKKDSIRILSIIGIAGTTETGNVDPLEDIADVAKEFNAHFHVDAAWGGPTLFSRKFSHLLKGIEKADSVTIDAHKQLYVPMGSGLVLYKNPTSVNAIEHHAQYIIRKGSRDLGSTTLEGSRPGMALLIHSGLKVIGKDGYELLINQGIEKANLFANLIEQHPDFELVTPPELNILTYRYCPAEAQAALKVASQEQTNKINQILSRVTKSIQKTQRERGKAFVSRTRLNPAVYGRSPCVVFRVVLANPLTTPDILTSILEEQRELSAEPGIATELQHLQTLVSEVRQATT
ncbi:cysteine sulfinic acid decarboxylase (Csad) [Oleiphilus messinensis]|uniref:Cysteine sulfinic acid decarboxylase (Csad) n=1 Tax=Oleiphilus messinensis TaxID=141451 RepID=A0A1Y0IE65_9GAMM|nr:putative pyridoxal-dependent aspartate 1-decarboxylase [Oleiphilus messinensis]ARU58741.1 cysteine sulfinic acid decarboxylase (Csad) [Oleiphilus messinensis]